MESGQGVDGGTPLKEIRSRFERMARGEKNIGLSRGELSFSDRGVRIRFSDLIPKERHSHGYKTLEAFREANAGVKESVVQVLDGDESAALGAVVDADGLVLTKASEVPDGVRCRLADGRVMAAQVVGIDPAFDLALLRMPASGLKPVAWVASGEPSVGTLVAVAGPGPLPKKIGNVSLPLLVPPGPFETTVHVAGQSCRRCPRRCSAAVFRGVATGWSMSRATRQPREFAQETCWYQSQECPFDPRKT